MHFTGEISLGTILTIVTLLGISSRIAWIVGSIQTTITDHTRRLDKYEGSLVNITGQMQRMVGRIEGVQDRIDRKL